jgi:protein-tyrosine phosphatase
MVVKRAGQITSRLWQGSVPEPGRPHPFDLIVLCAVEHQFDTRTYGIRPFGNRARVLRCPLRDDGTPPSTGQVSRAFAAGVEVARAYANGESIVVTCAMGLNRSGLVSALALMEMGVPVEDAIGAIRRARPGALGNPYFVQLLYSVAGRSIVRMPFVAASG